MAISGDTAALVAAQLTQAWATKTGAINPGAALSKPVDQAVLEVYLKFRDLVAEKDIGGGVL